MTFCVNCQFFDKADSNVIYMGFCKIKLPFFFDREAHQRGIRAHNWGCDLGVPIEKQAFITEETTWTQPETIDSKDEEDLGGW